MGNDGGDPLLTGGGGRLWVIKNGRHPVRDQAPVLHGPRRKVRNSNHVCGHDAHTFNAENPLQSI